MATDHLKELLRLKSSKPFCRFRVTTRQGQVFQVDDRLQYGFTETRFMYAVPNDDRLIEIPVEDIASVQRVQEQKPAA
jgi:hypothetical protein